MSNLAATQEPNRPRWAQLDLNECQIPEGHDFTPQQWPGAVEWAEVRALRSLGISPVGIDVFRALRGFQRTKGYSHVRAQVIADTIGAHRVTVQTEIGKLESIGAIVTVRTRRTSRRMALPMGTTVADLQAVGEQARESLEEDRVAIHYTQSSDPLHTEQRSTTPKEVRVSRQLKKQGKTEAVVIQRVEEPTPKTVDLTEVAADLKGEQAEACAELEKIPNAEKRLTFLTEDYIPKLWELQDHLNGHRLAYTREYSQAMTTHPDLDLTLASYMTLRQGNPTVLAGMIARAA